MIEQIHLKVVENFLFERPYMIGVKRGRTRVKENGEIFTPKNIVGELLDKLDQSDPSLFRGIIKLFTHSRRTNRFNICRFVV